MQSKVGYNIVVYLNTPIKEVMTSLLDLDIGDSYMTVFKDANHNIHRRRCKNRLRSKENICKNTCKKFLKNKLKKYKLRHDGKEDQDVIDVSDSLVYSLYIRSPNKARDSVELEIQELRPKNYLFRMVKTKQTNSKTTKISLCSNSKINIPEENGISSMSSPTKDNKQTNAFKLLMDSRNKSIGTNSPGKDKPKDVTELYEISEKKSIKAKRNLMLQKMAEEKGTLKKKEMEIQHENYLKEKMEKRAQKLKCMVLNKEPKSVTNEEINNRKTISILDSIETENNEKFRNKSLKTLQLVNMFNENDNETTTKKKISKEDEEFLKKLSPSMRKKESMLSYFKKIEKESESNLVYGENDNVVIKVKLGSSKKKRHKKNLSLKRDTNDKYNSIEILDTDPVVITNAPIDGKQEEIQLKNDIENSSIIKTERRKRKRDAKASIPCKDNHYATDTNDIRPKRTVKRPVKYSNDAALTSSDEELHIFTPKKKKHSDSKSKPSSRKTDTIIIEDETKTYKLSKKMNNMERNSKPEIKGIKNINPIKPVKLAPIFSKTQPDAAAIEAKQKFLQSGVPEELKKIMSKQKTCGTISNTFPTVVHVQQLESNQPVLTTATLREDVCLDGFKIDYSEVVFAKMLNLEISKNAFTLQSKNSVNTHAVLQNIKESYSRFPVHRIYKMLRGKKKGEFKGSNIFSNLDNSVEILNCSVDMQIDNPDQLPWSDKYKPLSGDEIIGNFANIKELKNWLITWTENKSKTNNGNESDSSDYYQSETDSRDSMKSYNNLLILSGPVGCGKTSCVYAVAAELSMKVIEINASSKRTGKKMLQDLQEATQSHKVNRGTSSENSQKNQEIVEPPEMKVRKRGRPKKWSKTFKVAKEKLASCNEVMDSQDSTRTAMSLILIDDADIVFEQDEGFCSAIMQLVQSSKRPVILVTGSLTIPHLQKFIRSSKVLEMKSLLPNMLGTWLDLVCLADSGICWPGMGEKFLNFFKGDMRRTINCLQFYIGSQEQTLSAEISSNTDSQNSNVKFGEDDENSSMSWPDHDHDIIEEKNHKCDRNMQPIWENFLLEHKHLKLSKCPLKIFDVWWNIPKILNIEYSGKNIQESHNSRTSLESISNVLDSISICDYLDHKNLETDATMISHPLYSSERDSLSELENLDHYDKNNDTTRKICCDLLIGKITGAQKKMGLENKYDLDLPRMSTKRQRDRIVGRHTALTSYLSQQSSLDRKALALDYWATCRDICRIERSKTDTNSKRNNRFCHYLKSLSVLCKGESFDALANSLNPERSS